MIQKKIGKKRPKLFRMTKKRVMALGDFIGHLRSHADQKDGFTRELLEQADKISPEKKAIRIKELNEEVAKFREAYDVLMTITNHHQSYLLEIWHTEKRGWENEWDIPLEVFERAIHTAVEFLEWNKTISRRHSSYFDEIIEVLQEMLAFRQNGESELEELA